MKRRSRWGTSADAADERNATVHTSSSNRSGKWVSSSIEVLDGGYFQGRDSGRKIIYRFDREGLSLRDLEQPNSIQWESQDASILRRNLWVNIPLYPDDSQIAAGDEIYSPDGGLTQHLIAAWAGPDATLWGTAIEMYVEDNVIAELKFSFASDSYADLNPHMRLRWDGSVKKWGIFGATPAAKPTVTGSRGSNAALASLLTGLATLGILTDSSS